MNSKQKSVAVIDSNFENTAGVDDNSDEEAPDLIALVDEINETRKNDIENETNTPVNAKEMAAAAEDPISALPPCPVTILSVCSSRIVCSELRLQLTHVS